MIFEALELIQELLVFVAYVSGAASFPTPMSAEEEKKCIERMKQGDESAKNELIERNLRLVAYIAKKYAMNGRDIDDIISIGTIGLIKAVNTYDTTKSKALSVYAARCIENEILMAVRAEKKTRGEIPMNDAIGTDKEGNKVMLIDLIGTPADSIELQIEYRFAVKQLYNAIGSILTKRERVIIELRYGLLTGECKTQREISALLGISRSYVYRRG